MKRLLILGLLSAVNLFSQITTVSVGASCNLDWNTPTGATSIIVNCTVDSTNILTDAKVDLANLVSTKIDSKDSAVILHFKRGINTITMMFWREATGNLVHAEIAANGKLAFQQDLTIP